MKSFIISISLFFLLGACARTERTEAVTAEITAAQMEGRNAARAIIADNWNDTIGIHRAIVRAKAPRLKYDSIGHSEASANFDSTFNNTIRTVRPDLAKKIGL